jgi:hypothetical protein
LGKRRVQSPKFVFRGVVAAAEKLACPQCGSDIDLVDQAYEPLIAWAKETIASIDQIQNSAQ